MPINKATIMTRGTTLGHVSVSSSSFFSIFKILLSLLIFLCLVLLLCWFGGVEEFVTMLFAGIMLMNIVVCWNTPLWAISWKTQGHLFCVIKSFFSFCNKLLCTGITTHMYKEREISVSLVLLQLKWDPIAKSWRIFKGVISRSSTVLLTQTSFIRLFFV